MEAAPSRDAEFERPLTITLPRSAWLVVAHYLGEAPFRDVTKILEAMTRQVEAQQRDEQRCRAAATQGGADELPAVPVTH